MIGFQDELSREVRALRLGRKADQVFFRECQRRKLNPEFAVLAPIGSLGLTQEQWDAIPNR